MAHATKSKIPFGFISMHQILYQLLYFFKMNIERWLWGSLGCKHYGFLALFLGFCQMHVPVLMLVDTYFSQNDPQYEANKEKKRKLLILISFTLSLLWGVVPLLGWTPMTFEPSGLSCAVYQVKPDMAYISYIMCCFVFFEFIPLAIVGYCKSQNKEESQSLKVNLFSLLNNNKIGLLNERVFFFHYLSPIWPFSHLL